MGIELDVDRLLLFTDVPAVMKDFGTPAATPMHRLDLTELETMTFPAGSMGPKIEACRRFVAATGRSAAIGSLSAVASVLAGDAGTTIIPGGRSSARATGAVPAASQNAFSVK